MEDNFLKRLFAKNSVPKEPGDEKAKPAVGPTRREFLAGSLAAGALALLGERVAGAEIPGAGQKGTKEAETVEEEGSVEVKKAIREAKDLMKEKIIKEIIERGVNDINLDHALLAFGDEPIIDGKSLLDLGASPLVDGNKAFFGMFQEGHPGAVSYSFIRKNIPWDKKMTVRGGKPMSVGEWIKNDVKDLGKNGSYSNDYEWALLLVVELSKRGIKVQLHDRKGARMQTADLVRLNQEEFDLRNDPSKLTAPAKKRLESIGGTCESQHALHALIAHALHSKDVKKSDELLNITFEQLTKFMDKKTDKENYFLLEKRLHTLSHILTIFTELPGAYPMPEDRKKLIKSAVELLYKDVMAYRASLEAINKEPEFSLFMEKVDVGALSHVVDVLEKLPAEFTK